MHMKFLKVMALSHNFTQNYGLHSSQESDVVMDDSDEDNGCEERMEGVMIPS